MSFRRAGWSALFVLVLLFGAFGGPLATSEDATSAAAQSAKAGAAAAGPAADLPSGPDETLRELGISGYADPLSVRPGQTVKFHVSSEHPRYGVEMVRMLHANPDPRGPGVQERRISAPANGRHRGSHQDLGLGSFARVPDSKMLRLDKSFTITAWIAPTTIPGSTENLLASPETPTKSPRPQGIVTKWSHNTGYGLYLDREGRLSLWLGDGSRVARLNTGRALGAFLPR